MTNKCEKCNGTGRVACPHFMGNACEILVRGGVLRCPEGFSEDTCIIPCPDCSREPVPKPDGGGGHRSCLNCGRFYTGDDDEDVCVDADCRESDYPHQYPRWEPKPDGGGSCETCLYRNDDPEFHPVCIECVDGSKWKRSLTAPNGDGAAITTLTEFFRETFSDEFLREADEEYIKAKVEGLQHDNTRLREKVGELEGFASMLGSWVREQYDKADSTAWGKGRKRMCTDLIDFIRTRAAVEAAEGEE